MRLGLTLFALMHLLTGYVIAQGGSPASNPETSRDSIVTPAAQAVPSPQLEASPRKRGLLGRMLHPFSSTSAPSYKDPKLRGLTLALQLSPQQVKLSEVRQLQIKLKLTNLSKRAI